MLARLMLTIAGLSLCGTAAAVPIDAVFHGGGSFSFVEIDYNNQQTAVQGRGLTPHVASGVDLEFRMHEFLRLGAGVGYEGRGGSIDAKNTSQPPESDNHAYKYTYHYIQFPLYARGILPLLIPGNVFAGVGLELGVNFSAEASDRAERTPPLEDTTIIFNFEEVTLPADFAMSLSLGYEISLNTSLAVSIGGGYYLGLADIYDKPGIALDARIHARSIRVHAGMHVNLAR